MNYEATDGQTQSTAPPLVEWGRCCAVPQIQCPRSSVEEQRSRKARAQVRFLPGALLDRIPNALAHVTADRGREPVSDAGCDDQHPGLTVRTTGRSSEVERRLWEPDAAGSIPAVPTYWGRVKTRFACRWSPSPSNCVLASVHPIAVTS